MSFREAYLFLGGDSQRGKNHAQHKPWGAIPSPSASERDPLIRQALDCGLSLETLRRIPREAFSGDVFRLPGIRDDVELACYRPLVAVFVWQYGGYQVPVIARRRGVLLPQREAYRIEVDEAGFLATPTRQRVEWYNRWVYPFIEAFGL